MKSGSGPWEDLRDRLDSEPRAPAKTRLAAVLRQMIDSGELTPGAQLPSEPELETASGTARNTVRSAIAMLIAEGLVESTQGRGTFVRERLTFTVLASEEEGARPSGGRDAFISAVRVGGRQPEAGRPRMEVRTAGAQVARRLHIEEDATVVVRRVERKIDGHPWSLQASYYPMDLAEGTLIMSPEDISHGAILELARHGHEQVGYRDDIVCRMPTEGEARFLGTAPTVPVLEMFRTAYSAERPIRMTINVYAGDSTHLAYDIGDVSARESS